jgi:hypothetical protein
MIASIVRWSLNGADHTGRTRLVQRLGSVDLLVYGLYYSWVRLAPDLIGAIDGGSNGQKP